MIAVPDIRIDGFLLYLPHGDPSKTFDKEPLRDDGSLFDFPTKCESRTGPLIFAEVHSKSCRKLDSLAQTECPTSVECPNVHVFDAEIMTLDIQTADQWLYVVETSKFAGGHELGLRKVLVRCRFGLRTVCAVFLGWKLWLFLRT